jgi:hypothetical protein
MEQQPLVSEEAGAEMVALHGLSPSVPRSGPVAPLIAGLSSKEVARLRAEALSPQASHNRSTSNGQITPSSSAGTEPSGAASSYDPQRLHSEVESLRREMERLRTEGLVVEAPPSYTEGDR